MKTKSSCPLWSVRYYNSLGDECLHFIYAKNEKSARSIFWNTVGAYSLISITKD